MVNWQKVIGLAVGLLVVLIMAMEIFGMEQSSAAIEYPIGFIELTKGGIEYGKIIDFNPPDGVSRIISAIITIQGDFGDGTTIYAKINGILCKPELWKVSSTIATGDISGYQTTFDCTDVFLRSDNRTQDIKFSTDKPSRNINAIYKIAYYNNPETTLTDIKNIITEPKISISIHGTEYQAGDTNGKVFLQLLNSSQEPITNTSCYINMFYPNTTTFVSATLMQNFTEGIHYYDFLVPNILGIYMCSAFCYIPNPIDIIASDDFECGAFFNCGTGWVNNWSKTGNVDVISTNAPIQGNWHMRLRGGATTATAERTINTNLTGCTNSYLTFYGRASGLEIGDYCYYTLNTGTKNITLLSITNPNDDNIYQYYSFEICQYNITESPKILLNGTGINLDDTCYIDDVNFDIIGLVNTTEYQKIMGSGEVHVNNLSVNLSEIAIQDVTASIWNFTSRTLTDYNQTQLFSGINDILGNLTITMAQINNINSSIMNKLYLIQDEISSVNNTVLATNQSVMNKLYLIQDDIASLLDNLTTQLINVSNITLNLTGDLQQVAFDVWELFFIRGTPPLAPSTEYYCESNISNILVKNITYNYAGQAFGGYFTKTEDIYCEYGCDSVNNMCYLPPYQRYGIVIALSIVILIIVLLLVRRYK